MTNKAAVRPSPNRKAEIASPASLDRGELDETLGYALRHAWVHMEQVFNRHLEGTGISPQYYAMLIVIENNPGCRISDLCRAVRVSPTNIVPALDTLLERGLVFRDFSTHDRRAKRLSLTENGTAFLAKLRTLHQPLTEHFEAKLGREGLAKLVSLLRTMASESE